MKSIIFGFFLVLCIVLTAVEYVYPQAGTQVQGGVVCPATGTSIQVIAANPSRMSYSLLNDSGVAVRIGTLATGTATLDDTNSFILAIGQTFADSSPGNYFGRVVCMSTTASPATIHNTQASR